MSQIVFILRASSPGDSIEEAEDFCEKLKGVLLDKALPHGITALVEYTVTPDPERL